MSVYVYIYIYIHTHLGKRIVNAFPSYRLQSRTTPRAVIIAHCGYVASANVIPVLREAMLFLLNHREVLQITVNFCPEEFADIF